MNNKLLIYCDGGFGNRFNSLISGLTLAIKLNYKPVVYWPTSNACRASFNYLFTDFTEFTEVKPNPDNYCNIFHMPSLGTNKFYNLTTISSFSKIKELARGRDILFVCCLIPSFIMGELHEEFLVAKDMIRFEESLVSEAQKCITENTSGSYFGMHLRKTDFGREAMTQSLEKSFRDAVVQNPEKSYFICSDDKSTEVDLAKYSNVFRFPKTSYTRKYKDGLPWSGPRGYIKHSQGQDLAYNVERDSENVRQAIVDILILSKSSILIKNTGSTFLDVAHLLKGKF